MEYFDIINAEIMIEPKFVARLDRAAKRVLRQLKVRNLWQLTKYNCLSGFDR